MKVKQKELLEQRIVDLEKQCHAQSNTLVDLLDYLSRTNKSFENCDGSFETWRTRLDKMRDDDTVRREVLKAKRVLEGQGMIVVENANDVDAAKIKHWMTVGKRNSTPDDDIPF